MLDCLANIENADLLKKIVWPIAPRQEPVGGGVYRKKTVRKSDRLFVKVNAVAFRGSEQRKMTGRAGWATIICRRDLRRPQAFAFQSRQRFCRAARFSVSPEGLGGRGQDGRMERCTPGSQSFCPRKVAIPIDFRVAK